MATRKPVRRITKHFQLRTEHPQDQHVIEVLDYAKSQRREVTVIRDAIELFYALEQGNLDALYAKFPQYRAVVGGDGGGGQIDEDKLVERIAERVAMMTVNNQYKMSPPTPAPTGKLLGGGKQVQAPTFEDDDEPPPTMVIKKSADVSSSARFLEALQSLH